MENEIARFEFKKHYAYEDEARKAIELFRRKWKFVVGLQRGPNHFRLRYQKAEIKDKNPLSPTCRSDSLKASAEAHFLVNFSARAKAVLVDPPQYPSPPSELTIDPNDPDVKSMYNRYVNYCSGGEFLPGMAYFCLTMLEYKFKPGARKKAAAKYNIDFKVLCKLGELSEKGGPTTGRKGGTKPLTDKEKRWLEETVKKVIYRAAQVAADDTQPLPKITMTNLPTL